MKNIARFLIFGFLFLSIQATSVQAQVQQINSISPNTSDIGQTLNVTISGTDITWSLCCGSACSGVTHAVLYKSGSTDILSNSHTTSGTSTINASFTIPNNASYLGLWGVATINNNSWCQNGYHLFKANLFNITIPPSQNTGFLSGRLYQDNDHNCAENAGDTPLKGKIFEINPGNIVVSTDQNGDFGLWLPLDTYTLSVPNSSSYTGSCPAMITANLLVPFDTLNVLVGMQADSIQDLSVAISTNIPRPGFNYYHYINYQNQGGLAVNATLKVAIDTVLQSLSSLPLWTSFSNDTAYYNLPNLSGGQSGNITLSTVVPVIPNVAFGQILKTYAVIEPTNTDTTPANNSFTDTSAIVGSYDPNDKRISPTGYGNSGSISHTDSLLTYHIRFQNTGLDTAFNILVKDTMSPNLNLGTLVVLGSSHPYQLSVDSGVVDWNFPNILLPDSNANEPESHGWIRYSIEQNSGLPHGTTIENTAAIYFDFNPPIFTNKTLNTICLPFTNSITSAHDLCPGDSLLLVSVSTGFAYNWSTGGTNDSTYVQSPGNYFLVMTDNFGCRSDSAIATIVPASPMVAGFNYSGNQLVYSFTDQSSGALSWNWDFGDGNISSSQNPGHNYAGQGAFTACLIANNGCFSDTSCQQITIVCPPPTSGFTHVTNALNLNTTNQTGPGITSWLWDFGDGSTSTQSSPSHSYSLAGNYLVCQVVGNGCGFDTTCSLVSVCNIPYANFLPAIVNYSVSFTDMSSYNPTSWSWSFGDGNTSTQQNPTHIYAGNGTYTVCLSISNSCSSTSKCQSVLINCIAPASAFSVIVPNLTGTFSNLSSGTPTSWLWSFGDGNSSTLENPSHQYAVQGIYSVCQTVSNSCGIDTSCQQITTGCALAGGNFSYTISNFTVSFNGSTNGPTTIWSWDFGDGSTSLQQNPSHIYTASGAYSICLITSNACGNDTSCQIVLVNCTMPVAAFGHSTNNFTTNFTDLSSGSPSSWSWDFGDGSTSFQQNPSHIYTASGAYSICLITSNACGNDTSCQTVLVNCTKPVAAFGHSTNNFTTNFNDLSTNLPTIWIWDFGDGGTSFQQNPSHTYAANGNYSVCLITSNACGIDTSCQTVLVNCTKPVAAFGHSTNNFTTNFTDLSTYSPTIWSWDFGDGGTSFQQNPSHTYAASGAYSICLITSNACGSDISCQTVLVNCTMPMAAFGHSTNNFTTNFTDLSTNSPTIWSWDFGDGGASFQQNPSHIYAANGNYSVCLITSKACGKDTSCQTVVVNCTATIPTAVFSHSQSNLTVTFSDLSMGSPSGWDWDFGDGNISTLQNPTHTYASGNTYTVCLTAIGGCGSHSNCEPLLLTGTLEDGLGGAKITVFPNPAQDLLFAKLELDAWQLVRLELYSAHGQMIRQKDLGRIKDSTFSLNLDEISSGIYFLQVITESGIVSRKVEIRKE